VLNKRWAAFRNYLERSRNTNPGKGDDYGYRTPIWFLTAGAKRRSSFTRRLERRGLDADALQRKSGTPAAWDGAPGLGEQDHAHELAHRQRYCADGCSEGANFQGFSLSLSVANEAEAEHAFTALSDGGQVRMPLTKTFWSPRFGMLADRFGVGWLVTVAP
jgi:hypothetical protein